MDDQHIRGSPFPVAGKLPIEKLCTAIGGLDGPWEITFNQKGEVVIAEWRGNCVSIFSSSGEKIQSFGTRDSGKGHPCGVEVDDEGNILVEDSNNHRIQKFTTMASSPHQLVLEVMDVYSLVILVASHLMQLMIRCMLQILAMTEYKF